MDRRDFIKIAGLGGVVFASSLGSNTNVFGRNKVEDFYFVQLSDTHWGFDGPSINPDAQGSLKKAIAAVNGLNQQPDFVVFTGDLTHISENVQVRRDRLNQFREIAGGLKTKTVHFMPGEHDASLDRGEVYQELIGKLNYSFEHKGVHFVVIDNVSDPAGIIGDAQLKWLKSNLISVRSETPVVVLTHRPLFDLYPQWDWTTRDASAALELLMPYKNVTVFYGHIHQEHHHMMGHIAHHAATSLMFPLPAPGSAPKRAPIPWDPALPYKGLGFRRVEEQTRKHTYRIDEMPLKG